MNNRFDKSEGDDNMGVMDGNPKNEPLHYGEIAGMWTYLKTQQGKKAAFQTLMNHVGDEDLKGWLVDYIKSALTPQIQEITTILRENGIAIPPAPPERSEASLNDIPSGARFNDNEIGSAVAMDIAANLIGNSSIIGQCIREDIAAMFVQNHATGVQFGLKILRIQKEKGWIIPPPLEQKHQEPVNV